MTPSRPLSHRSEDDRSLDELREDHVYAHLADEEAPMTHESQDDLETRVEQRSDGGWAVEYRQNAKESWGTVPRRFTTESAAMDYAADLAEHWDG